MIFPRITFLRARIDFFRKPFLEMPDSVESNPVLIVKPN